MKKIFLIVYGTLTIGFSTQGQENNQKQNEKSNVQNFQSVCLRGFDSTGNLTKELTSRELEIFFQLIYRDTSVAQIKNTFEHPNKQLAPIVGKLSEETKRLLLKSAQFGPGPKNCSKDQSP